MSMSEQMIPAPPPKTELERYRILSSTAGVKVSPLCLGAMSLGEAWKNDMGSLNKEKSFELLDAFYNAGGNFIDTANNYQNEESERFIGEWMETRQNRDEMVIATKFTTNYRMHEIGKGGRVVNFTGNSRKSIHMSVDASLRKLRTSYIDVLYLHYWDWTSGVKEIMDSLHILIEQGKVLYLGISNTPAWIVAEANTYATAHGKTPFSVYQGRWNLLQRSFEREILPMAQRFGMALCPWDVLGSGKFQSRAQLEARAAQGESLRSTIGNAYAWTKDRTPEEERISDSLEEVAKQLGGGATVQQVAIAWIMQKTPNVFPLLGGRKVEHLHDNIKALSLRLTQDQIRYLESVNDFDFGYPTDIMGPDPRESGGSSMIMSISAHVDFVKAAKAIGLE